MTPVGVVMLFAIAIAFGATLGLWKPVAISLMAFAAMGLGALLRGDRVVGAGLLAVADGLGAGMMLTSACLFLLPTAVQLSAANAGIGLASGLIVGGVIYQRAERTSGLWQGWPPAIIALSLHALAAGVVVGMIYTTMPAVGLILGVAIVAHKLPAGYAAAQELTLHAQSKAPVLVPSCMVGIASVPTALIAPTGHRQPSAAVFGFGTGVFLAVALAFLVRTPSRHTAGASARRLLGALIGFAVIAALARFVV